ncbi:DNA-binding PadR family transcriptional regulator [Sediminihabitans luteus]|uniref:DNA-binding PadR family transcriptional regulator n=1 Tax=Sediminihabitans luteus TaxID=1138585 RepID=A0A2M9CE59_9CELL|nr:PadR family transcriptional regulator [Sediminihabitans luteus]PJJ70140.1 DNA-binding PadR family transcriptional regulator [Sediminihabitans luteus]GIJ00559.1 hypothetical protein Slu03_29360 [Sediminihabitans luteus]
MTNHDHTPFRTPLHSPSGPGLDQAGRRRTAPWGDERTAHHHDPRGTAWWAGLDDDRSDRRGGGRGRRGGFPGPDGAPGGPGPRRGGPHGPRGRRGPRGDVRGAVLLLLAEGPKHGYQLIQDIAERSGGIWQPSPGAVYPALNLLEDEGLVTITADGGRKLASLTEAGRTHLAAQADAIGDPFQAVAEQGPRGRVEMHQRIGAVMGAVQQVARTGTDAQVEQALALLDRTRRELYLILAGPEAPEAAAAAPAAPGPDAPRD